MLSPRPAPLGRWQEDEAGGNVRLVSAFEQMVAHSGRNTDARIADLDLHPDLVTLRLRGPDGHADISAIRELQRIVQQIGGALAYPQRIEDKVFWYIPREAQFEGQPLRDRDGSVQLRYGGDLVLQVRANRTQFDHALLDPRQVQHVVHQSLETERCPLQRRDANRRGRMMRLIVQQLANTHDRVQRGAQLMTHRGEELTFRGARRPCGVAGNQQSALEAVVGKHCQHEIRVECGHA